MMEHARAWTRRHQVAAIILSVLSIYAFFAISVIVFAWFNYSHK